LRERSRRDGGGKIESSARAKERGRKRVRERREREDEGEGREAELGMKSRITASMYALTFANDCQAILPYVSQFFLPLSISNARQSRLHGQDKLLPTVLNPFAL